MKRLIVSITFISLILVITYHTVYGQKGLLHLRKLNSELNKIENTNRNYKINNILLRKEIDLLKYNFEYIEECARLELGLVKKNEIIYHIQKK